METIPLWYISAFVLVWIDTHKQSAETKKNKSGFKVTFNATSICPAAKKTQGGIAVQNRRASDWKEHSDIVSCEHLLQICTVQAVWRFILGREIIIGAQQHDVAWQMRLS